MSNRRKFLSHLAGGAGLFAFSGWHGKAVGKALTNLQFLSEKDAVFSEDVWAQIRQAYDINTNVANLNNGGVSPHPSIVQEAMFRFHRQMNTAPSLHLWRSIKRDIETVRSRLALLAGCNTEEIAILRNTTEALDNVIFGLDLEKGDEVILAKQDYPNMIHAWQQREKRDGIKLVWVDLPLSSEDNEELASLYTKKFTNRTKVVHITHMINWTGQLIPVKRISKAAREKGITSIVDGAHTFAHLDFNIPDLACDYFGTSLHKWLGAPFGTGMLYARKDKIAEVWPLFPNGDNQTDDIRKFEGIGTHATAIEAAIGGAIDFHLAIGSKRKEQRLQYLKNYWAENLPALDDRVSMLSTLNPEFSCGIATFHIEGNTPLEVSDYLFKNHYVAIVGVEWANIKGVRVTPNVYTSTYELDRLITGLKDFLANH